MVGLHLSTPVLEICLNIEKCLKFEAKTTVTVNQEPEDPWTFVVLFIVTVIVNSVSAVIIGRQERSGINTMIICDCLVNVLNMGVYSLNIESWRLLGSDQLCTMSLFFRVTLITWNNLVPVAIAVQRYLLVCRAVACHNLGGGKRSWTFIHSVVVFLCFLCGAIFALERNSSLTFLRCMGEEEKFWYVVLLVQNCLVSFPFSLTGWSYSGVPDHYWSSGTTWKTFTPLCPRAAWSSDNPSGPLLVFSSTSPYGLSYFLFPFSTGGFLSSGTLKSP